MSSMFFTKTRFFLLEHQMRHLIHLLSFGDRVMSKWKRSTFGYVGRHKEVFWADISSTLTLAQRLSGENNVEAKIS